MRTIRLTFVRENVFSIAVLLEDKAPQTCACIWEGLTRPVEGPVVHAMFTGRELSFSFPRDALGDKGLRVPPENQTCFPIPGDLIWNAYRPYEWQGVPEPVYDFGIFYGRDSRLLLPMGWRPSNHFGSIVENLPVFAEVAARCQREGMKTLRIERNLA